MEEQNNSVLDALSQADSYSIENALIENSKMTDEEKLNPWISIWTKPRKTIRYIINNDPTKYIALLGALYGINSSLNKASSKCLGDTLSLLEIFLIAIIGGALGGILMVYVYPVFLEWTGKWLGGTGSREDIRAAVAWGHVPFICSTILWIPELILFGKEMFTTSTPRMDESILLVVAFFILLVIEGTMSIWGVVVGLKCLSEVQDFSVGKAIVNYILPTLIILVPLVIVVVLFAL